MKIGKLWRVIVCITALSVGSGSTLLVMNSCNFFGGDDGGSGADFDATQYYAKTQVNELLDNLFRGVKNDTYQQLAGVDFAGKAPVGWVVPEGATAGFFEVNVGASGAPLGAVNIIVSSVSTEDAPDIQFTPASSGYSTALFLVPSLTAGTTVYAWHTTLHGGASALTNLNVAVRCRGWIR